MLTPKSFSGFTRAVYFWMETITLYDHGQGYLGVSRQKLKGGVSKRCAAYYP